MKTSYYLFVALFLTAAVSGCKKDSPASSEQPVISDSPQTATQTYTSTSGGTFSTQSGYGLTVIGGAVPRNASNQPGSIAFSIETKVTPPKPIPAGAILKGDVVKFGPDGFDFQWPVEATLKFPANTDPTALNILYYNPSSEKWVAVAGS